MRVAGVDEAGRGPLIGPMVVALAAVEEEKLSLLQKLGTRDSKLLTPARRRRLRVVLESVLDYVAFRVVAPEEIDRAVMGEGYENLNHLELTVVAELVRRAVREAGVARVYVDSPDPVARRFEERLRSELAGVDVIAENHADRRYVIVSAASILAKTERDRIIEELKSVYGDFGSGYPSDPKTRLFVEKWIEEHGEPPPIVRRSWKTLKRLRRKG